MIEVHKKPVIVLVCIFILFWVGFAIQNMIKSNNHSKGDFSGVKERGVLRVCGENDLFSFYSDENGFHGYHYELAKAFAKQTGLKLEFIAEPDFEKRLKLLTTGKCDIIAGPLPVINELKQIIDYTEPIYTSRLMLIQKKDRLVRNQIHLSEYPIYIQKGSPSIYRIHNIADELCDSIKIREIPVIDSKHLFEAVKIGICDYAACDEHVAIAYQYMFPEIDMETPLGFEQFHAWAVKKGNKGLIETINSFLDTYKKSLAFRRLSSKYSFIN
jgi:membrane-bound lytic murein transglycosylase MltF